MSKAFTNEDAPDELPLGRLPERARAGEERPITAAGYRALLSERQALLDAGRPSGEEALRDYEYRLALVSSTLESVRVTEPPTSLEAVAFGLRVSVRWEDGRTQSFVLVGPDEADARGGRLSVASPLASAVLGLGVSDEGELALPRGVEHFEVIAIAPDEVAFEPP